MSGTVICLSVGGLTVTSGLVQLGMFLWALFAWVVVGSRARRADMTVADVTSTDGAIDITQTGPSPSVTRVMGAGNVHISQRTPDA